MISVYHGKSANPPAERTADNEMVAFRDGDDRHVAACLRRGGFCRVELVAGRAVWVWPEGVRR